jgi:putative nucleotidyltransferase with HDIG domain
MEKYNMLSNIKLHSIVVAKVSHLIASGLRHAGIEISIEKVVAGALLHDIGKTISLDTSNDHAKIGSEICRENNFHEVADIVAEHVVLKDYSVDGDYSEKEIVYYGDKRVNHDRIVSLDERENYILERYGRNIEELRNRIKANFLLCREVENKLFKKLDFDAETLPRLALNEDIGL